MHYRNGLENGYTNGHVYENGNGNHMQNGHITTDPSDDEYIDTVEVNRKQTKLKFVISHNGKTKIYDKFDKFLG